MTLDDIDTPALIIDLDKMEANINRLHHFILSKGKKVRVHSKTHKVPAIAHLQLQAGAIGIAAQKLGEAEVMADAGIQDILLSYNIIGASKLERLIRLAKRCQMMVTLDNLSVAQGISQAAQAAGVSIDVLVELESSELQRTGVHQVEDLVELARQVHHLPGLRLRGLMMYPSLPVDAARIAAAVKGFKAAGLPVEIVSGGGTPAAWQLEQIPELTEVRIGDYVFNCKNIIDTGVATLEQCALLILTTVVSRPVKNRAIIDAGSKTLGCGGHYPLGYIIELPQATIYGLNEEHGYVDVSACAIKPEIGARLTVIPECCGGTINLHDTAYAVRGAEVVAVWQIQARGKVR